MGLHRRVAALRLRRLSGAAKVSGGPTERTRERNHEGQAPDLSGADPLSGILYYGDI
jgi:hypothetical protein